MIMNLYKVVKSLFPNAIEDVDFELRDDGLGNGPYIYAWNMEQAKPSNEALKKESERLYAEGGV